MGSAEEDEATAPTLHPIQKLPPPRPPAWLAPSRAPARARGPHALPRRAAASRIFLAL